MDAPHFLYLSNTEVEVPTALRSALLEKGATSRVVSIETLATVLHDSNKPDVVILGSGLDPEYIQQYYDTAHQASFKGLAVMTFAGTFSLSAHQSERNR